MSNLGPPQLAPRVMYSEFAESNQGCAALPGPGAGGRAGGATVLSARDVCPDTVLFRSGRGLSPALDAAFEPVELDSVIMCR